jgi:hypothetical protein
MRWDAQLHFFNRFCKFCVIKEVYILLRIGIVGLGNMSKLHLFNAAHDKSVASARLDSIL